MPDPSRSRAALEQYDGNGTLTRSERADYTRVGVDDGTLNLWTEPEIAFLKANAHLGWRAVAEVLGRPYGSVKYKASALGIRSEGDTGRKSSWSRPVRPGEEWRDRAACKGMGPDVFYPLENPKQKDKLKRRHDPYVEARAICAPCPVRRECLQDVLADRDFDWWGMRGGLDPVERREFLREQDEVA